MTERTEAAADEIESQRETIRSLHTAIDDLTRAGLEMERSKNEEIAVLRADLARARRNAAHFEQLFENVEKARAWFSRELDAARAAVGEAWFTGSVTLAEAIARKCRALESDAAKAAAELERLRRDNEIACENTPWPGCECPGCETERARAEAELKGGSDG